MSSRGLGAIGLAPVVAKERLVDQVVSALREAITSGALAPGTHLSVPAIAERLNVSRTPARDALFQLDSEGLVEVVPRRGAVVVGGRVDDLVELFEIREALEGMAARLGAQRRDDGQLAAVRAAFEAHAAAIHAGDLEGHLQHDTEFHNLVAAAAGNARIADQLGRTREQLRLLTRAMSVKPGALDDRVVEIHETILTAMTDKNPRLAERAMRSHVRAILSFYLSQLPKRGGRPTNG